MCQEPRDKFNAYTVLLNGWSEGCKSSDICANVWLHGIKIRSIAGYNLEMKTAVGNKS